MDVMKTSTLTGNVHIRNIDVTDDQLREWRRGALIQNVMPHLSAADREFLMTGTTPEEWTDLENLIGEE
jgi:hypothetical protein